MEIPILKEDFNFMNKIPDNGYVLNKLTQKHNFTLGAEIGVRRGDLTESLLLNNDNLKMICVDIWDDSPELNEHHDHLSNYQIYKNKIEPFKNRVIEHRMLSTQAASFVEDNSLDFIFIDATHTKKAFIEDYSFWFKKLKHNGIISGHDYHDFFDNGLLKQAIDEYIGIDLIVEEDDYDISAIKVVELLNANKGIAESKSTCWYKPKNNCKIIIY
jgi:predicted O-methyltransferase YrrM